MTQLVKGVIPTSISEELKNSYLDYAMSVIVARALPDVRDGMKPVHRRILYAMYEQGNTHNKPYKKSARIVGDVLGKYHPHGDTAVYDALVRLAQDFSMRYPLIDGQGNFGSIDGDSPAAMRYTEVRMAKTSAWIMECLDEDTVDFGPNYDNSEREPLVLPTVLPQLLVNGQTGIAVGMATNIPPHNLSEVLDALVYMLERDETTVEELLQFIKGPDFPTAGIICGTKGIHDAYRTGRGSIVVRGRAQVETLKNGRDIIVINELPYQVNKASLIERIAELVKEEEIVGISDIRDESNKEGIRVVIDLKKGENGEVLLNHLYKKTRLQDSFGVNLVCIVRGVPRLLNLRECLEYFKDHRIEVITRRTQFRLRKAEDKLHILAGLKIAVENMDAVVKLIRSAESPEVARIGLMEQFQLSERQANAILEMRLARLTGLEREKILNEYNETVALIADYKDILERRERVRAIVKDEFLQLKAAHGDERRTEITLNPAEDVDIGQLIAPAEVFLTFSSAGYIKRVVESEFRAQSRGGKGKTGAALKENDVVKFTLRAHTHDHILMFSNLGKVYSFFVYEIPEAVASARGKSVAQILTLQGGEHITNMLPLREFTENQFIFMVTEKGVVKKSDLTAFANIRTSGLRAISLDEGDHLVSTFVTNGSREVILASANGKAIRFDECEVRAMGRSAHGVTGIDLDDGDVIVAAECVNPGEKLVVVTEKGYGKRSDLDEYRKTHRAGSGVRTVKITERNGKVAALLSAPDTADVMLTSNQGGVIRVHVKDIKISGRVTQGTILKRVADGEFIVSVSKPNEFDTTPVTQLEATEEAE
jgi:DNA gyrase subunit A